MKPSHTRLRLGAAAILVGVSALANLAAATPALAAEAHVLNPYSGPWYNTEMQARYSANQYVNSDWSTKASNEANGVDATLAKQIQLVASQPTAVWFDSIASINGSGGKMGLTAHLDAALAQQTAHSGRPEVITIVIYDLPGRDCNSDASNGELGRGTGGPDADIQTYEQSYINPIADILGNTKYQSLRIATIIEPDALGNAITNQGNPACVTAKNAYEQGISYALGKLHAINNVYTYLDATNASWLGWPANITAAVTEFKSVANRAENPAGVNAVDGFAINVSNTDPTKEPFIDSQATYSATKATSSSWYGQAPIDEQAFAARLYTALTGGGFPASIGFIVDTGRNGWGGSTRPTQPNPCIDPDAFVRNGCGGPNAPSYVGSKVDLRTARGAWCNPDGAGLGELPQGDPYLYSKADRSPANLIAYVWVKPPGESDGNYTGTPGSGIGSPGSDPFCDPTWAPPNTRTIPGGGTPPVYTGFPGDGQTKTGALTGAPAAGQWFSSQFVQLVKNAYPAIPAIAPAASGNSCRADIYWSSGWPGGANYAFKIVNTGTAVLKSYTLTWASVDYRDAVNYYDQISNSQWAVAPTVTYNGHWNMDPPAQTGSIVTARGQMPSNSNGVPSGVTSGAIANDVPGISVAFSPGVWNNGHFALKGYLEDFDCRANT